jgi:cytochrome P450
MDAARGTEDLGLGGLLAGPSNNGDARARGDLPLLGSLLAMRSDVLRFILGEARRQGDVARFRLGSRPCFLVTHAEGVKAVLQEGHASFRKNPHYTDTVGVVLGQGLITSEGELHLRNRRLMQPAFHVREMEGVARVVVRLADELAGEWEGALSRGAVVDVHDDMSRLALKVVLETLFGNDLAPETLARMIPVLRELNEDIFRIVKVPRWVPTARNRRFGEALAEIEDVLNGIMATRRGFHAPGNDLLGTLMSARDPETGESLGDRALRDEVVTMFAAGHETSANSLAWTLEAIGRNPEVGARLREELRRELGGSPPTLAALARLPYVRMVVEESMRLYPPTYLMDRVAARDVEVGGIRIPAGATVYLSPYVTHRRPDYWEAPEIFDPERFSPDRAAARPRFAYFPFGAGPRQCIGSGFASMEIQLALATLAQRWEVLPIAPTPPTPQPNITLCPPHPLPMRLRPA